MNNSLLIYVYSCYMFVVTKKCYNFKNEFTNINNAVKKLYFLFEKIDHNYYFRFKHCT